MHRAGSPPATKVMIQLKTWLDRKMGLATDLAGTTQSQTTPTTKKRDPNG